MRYLVQVSSHQLQGKKSAKRACLSSSFTPNGPDSSRSERQMLANASAAGLEHAPFAFSMVGLIAVVVARPVDVLLQ